MRSSVLMLSSLLVLSACTENQDLGDRPELDGGLPTDGTDDDGETSGNRDGDETSAPDDWDGSKDPSERPSESDFEFGTFEPFEVAASGIAPDIYSIIGVTSVAGPIGCGIASQPEGAPGEAGARAYAKPYTSVITTCSEGVYSIQNDPDTCAIDPDTHTIDSDCAIYQRWDEDGELVANVLATGGAVAVTLEEVGARYVCKVELSLRFPGGRVDHNFEFDVEPGSQDICVR